MNFKMKTGEDFTVTTKGGYTVTIPDNTGLLYQKPQTGIPKTDLASAVQTSLDRINSASNILRITDNTLQLSENPADYDAIEITLSGYEDENESSNTTTVVLHKISDEYVGGIAAFEGVVRLKKQINSATTDAINYIIRVVAEQDQVPSINVTPIDYMLYWNSDNEINEKMLLLANSTIGTVPIFLYGEGLEYFLEHVIQVNGTGILMLVSGITTDSSDNYILTCIGPCDTRVGMYIITFTSAGIYSSYSGKVLEDTSARTQTINAQSTEHQYPSAKAVYDGFCRKPVVVWETNSTGLTALETDMSANPNWQLTDLDFSGFSYVKIYTKAAQKSGTTASASTTASMVLEMSLDSRAAGPYGGHYIGSMISQKPNDANRFATLTCAISADKTSFAVIRMSNLYGTAATGNSDVGGEVFKIVGYYD